MAAFVAAIVVGGSNFVAVRFMNAEIPPFFGSGARFIIAALIFFALMRLGRVPFPYGAALIGALVYGVVGFAISYAFAYTGLQQVPAGTASVVIASVPLLTAFLAVAHRTERLRWRVIAGALIGIAGVALVFFEQLSASVPALYLLAMVGNAAAAAEANVLLNRFPRTHPISTNAIATLVGGVLLLAASFVLGESHALPKQPGTWAVFAYIATLGTVGLFIPVVYLVNNWSASAASYVLLGAPIVAISIGAVLLGEMVTPFFLVGAVIVAIGVYVGALMPGARSTRT